MIVVGFNYVIMHVDSILVLMLLLLMGVLGGKKELPPFFAIMHFFLV